MRHRAAAFLLLCAGACAGGAARIEVEPPGPRAPWTHLDVADAPGDFQFVIVTDRTGDHRAGIFEKAVDKINLLQPAFVVSVGDLIEGYTEDPAELDAMWAEFDGLVGRLQMPFFYTPGNHDYSNSVMARDWRRRFGPSYYHFRYKDVLFLVLNSELFSSVSNPGHPVEGGDTQEAQMRHVERVLDAHAGARWTLVFLHQPLWDSQRRHADWERVEKLLGDRPYSVFAGHLHSYTKHIRRDRKYITLATTGGGSRLRGIDRGEFDHVALVTMGEASRPARSEVQPSEDRTGGPVIANLMLDGIHDDAVRTAATRTLVGQLDQAVTVLPLLVEGDVFRGGEQQFALRNAGQSPVTIRGRFDAGPHFTPTPREVERTLAPGQSETLAVALRAEGRVRVSELTPSLAHWTAETPGEQAPVRVENTAFLVPERLFPVGAPRAPVEVDAALGEWGRLRFAQGDWPMPEGGSATASLRFDVSADDDFLYIALDVSDPTPVHSQKLSVRDQDAVTIELDARPDPARSANEAFLRALGKGTTASLLISWLSPVEPAPDRVLTSFLPAEPAGLRRVARTREGGYTAELAVPRAFLDERAGGPWERFRLNVVLQDFDAEGAPGRSHYWRPSRFGPTSGMIPRGAGTFVRD